jgi:hypothetical protein
MGVMDDDGMRILSFGQKCLDCLLTRFCICFTLQVLFVFVQMSLEVRR